MRSNWMKFRSWIGPLVSFVVAVAVVPMGPTPARASGPAPIVIIMMENHSYGQIIGKPNAPYFNSLASTYTTFTQMYSTVNGNVEPYEDLTGGDNPRRQDPLFTCKATRPSKCQDGLSNIVDQLEAAGLSWKAYIEDYPRPGACDITDSQVGAYAIRHVPWLYYTDINGLNGTPRPDRCANLVGLDQLSTDMTKGALPAYSMVTPNLYTIMHSSCTIGPCPAGAPDKVAQGDAFLSQWVPQLINAGAEVIVTFADGKATDTSGCCTYAKGGRVATVEARSGMAHRTVTTPMDLFSILRGIEDAYKLAHLGLAACSCTPALPL